MSYDDEIDSLTLEIDRIASSRAHTSSTSLLRPATTGELEAKSVIKPTKQRTVVESYVDKPSRTSGQVMRPRAPMMSRRGGEDPAPDRHATRLLVNESQSRKDSYQGGQVKSDFHANREDSYDSVSASNATVKRESRSRNVERQGRSSSSDDMFKAADSDIHFVNIDSKTYESRPPSGGAVHADQQMAFQRRDPNEIMRSAGKTASAASSEFIIPELPRGRQLMVNILSTWGDPSYVGLMGLEVFDREGRIARPSDPKRQLWADPADINVLPEYENDPRTVKNLIDGVNCTCDDTHSWLAPFTKGSNHIVAVQFDSDIQISMIRIWNYNKNRIHSQRGARYVQITLDKRLIFRGEIKRAPGSAADPEAASECILFTTNPSILAMIERNDPLAQLMRTRMSEEEAYEKTASSKKVIWSDVIMFLDPSKGATDSGDARSDSERDDAVYLNQSDYLPTMRWKDDGANRRPTTGKSRKPRETAEDIVAVAIPEVLRNQSAQIRPSTAAIAKNMPPALVSRHIDVFLLTSWGDPAWVGLSEMRGIDSILEEFPLNKPQVSYCLPPGNSTNDYVPIEEVDSCAAESIVRSTGMTSCLEDMWVIAQRRGLVVRLRFSLNVRTAMKGIRIWNFNAGHEDTSVGVKHIEISIDGGPRKQLIVRKAPGDCNFDYSQFLPISRADMALAGTKSLDGTSASNKTLRERVNSEPFDMFTGSGTIMRARSDSPSIGGAHDPGFKVTLGPISDSFEEGFEDLVYPEDDVNGGSKSNRSAFSSGAPIHQGSSPDAAVCQVNQQYETPVTPAGCCIKFVLSSTHGDPYYIGLNGIEIFDAAGNLIPIDPDQLQGIPFRDVNDLLQVQKKGHDARCIENLVEPHNNTYEDRYMWLAPLAQLGVKKPSGEAPVPNTIFVLFDEPIVVGLIRLYNYSKTPSRGAKAIEIFVDDVLVFSGDLRPSPAFSDLPVCAEPVEGSSFDHGINWGSRTEPRLAQTILFTNDATIVAEEESRIPYSDDCIEFIDEGNRVTSVYNAGAADRGIDGSSPEFSRPLTSVGSRRG